MHALQNPRSFKAADNGLRALQLCMAQYTSYSITISSVTGMLSKNDQCIHLIPCH